MEALKAGKQRRSGWGWRSGWMEELRTENRRHHGRQGAGGVAGGEGWRRRRARRRAWGRWSLRSSGRTRPEGRGSDGAGGEKGGDGRGEHDGKERWPENGRRKGDGHGGRGCGVHGWVADGFTDDGFGTEVPVVESEEGMALMLAGVEGGRRMPGWFPEVEDFARRWRCGRREAMGFGREWVSGR